MVGNESKNVELHTNKADGKSLSESVQEFIRGFSESFPKTFALLYSSSHCYLALVDEQGKFEVKDNAEKFALDKVFEARVFNEDAELRWLNETNGYGSSAVLSENEFSFFDEKSKPNNCVKTIMQNYLLWGEVSPNNKASENWTEFAEARIGKFYVPVKTGSRACFTAIEYLKSFEDQDGNVAVIDERLKGIKPYSTETKGGNQDADK
ncbi:hypothetical protein BH20ACI4_BH20ACI4_15470 [soil metagenome]